MAKPDLLSIPAEIRSIIYTTLFDDADLSLRITRYGAIDTSKWPLPIVRVCKLLRVEALHLLQEHNIWLLCENGVFPRKIHEKLPEWIYKRVRVIQMSRTAHAMFQFPLPSRSTFPKLESVIIDFDGFGRVEGTIDDSLEEHPRLRQPEHVRRPPPRGIVWRRNGKEWSEHQLLASMRRERHRMLSRELGRQTVHRFEPMSEHTGVLATA
ncbi:hypothetical protein LTS08_007080 [Lithohypha guttulata]|nr:hypothetical protein LTS08_007080 [Lithohypha guttulata]